MWFLPGRAHTDVFQFDIVFGLVRGLLLMMTGTMLWLVSCVRRALYMTQALPGWVGVTGHLRKQIIHMLLRKTMKKKTVVFKRIDGLGGSTISKVSLNYMSKDAS
jgi:hypothetical protein